MRTELGTEADRAVIMLGMTPAGEHHLVSADTLADLSEIAHQIDRYIEFQVEVLRDRDASWEDVGRALGISRQGAQQRFRYVDQRREWRARRNG